jgi:hypothetical protein
LAQDSRILEAEGRDMAGTKEGAQKAAASRKARTGKAGKSAAFRQTDAKPGQPISAPERTIDITNGKQKKTIAASDWQVNQAAYRRRGFDVHGADKGQPAPGQSVENGDPKPSGHRVQVTENQQGLAE